MTASAADASAPATGPYVGPRPFERAETPAFRGRDRETGELVSLVVSSRVVLLYAPSGAGKTSLLNAGLIPALEQEGFDVLPVARIRPLVVGPAPPGDAANVFAVGVLSTWEQVANDTTVGDFLARRRHTIDADGFPDPRAIVIDQFEELFTAYPEHWPQRQPFLRQLADALDRDPLLRIVLAIREDYLAQLEAYADALPGGLKHRYRLDRLGRTAALSAVTGPLEPTARSFAPGVAEQLVDDLLTFRIDRGDRTSVKVPGEFVEPVHLQVVCRRLWEGLPPDATEITQRHLRASGDVDEVLAQLYDDAVREAVSRSGAPEPRIRRWIEEALITSGGTRGTVYRGPSSTGNLPNEAVDALESSRLIRAEWRAGARWYELTHDRLIDPIQDSNARYLAAAARRRRRRLALSALAAPAPRDGGRVHPLARKPRHLARRRASSSSSWGWPRTSTGTATRSATSAARPTRRCTASRGCRRPEAPSQSASTGAAASRGRRSGSSRKAAGSGSAGSILPAGSTPPPRRERGSSPSAPPGRWQRAAPRRTRRSGRSPAAAGSARATPSAGTGPSPARATTVRR